MKISIIIPCYNEEKNIGEIVKRFLKVKKRYDIELILVDNGSSDETYKEIHAYANKYPFIKENVVRVNRGYGYGILSGLSAAQGDYLGWMHADLQSDPYVFCSMIDAALGDGQLFLYKGRRKKRPLVDTLFTIGMSIFGSLYLHVGLWDINAQPTLLSRSYYEQWEDPPHDFMLDLYVYYWAKKSGAVIKRFESIQYNRLHGKSTWNFGLRARLRPILRTITYSKELRSRGVLKGSDS